MAMTCDDGDAWTTLDTVMPRACNLGRRVALLNWPTTVTWLARTTVAMRRDDAVVNANERQRRVTTATFVYDIGPTMCDAGLCVGGRGSATATTVT